jgi:hypothetical protein
MYYSLRQTQLYPLQAGNVELEPASVENEIHFVKEEYLKNSGGDDLFGDFSSIAIPPDALVNEKVTLQSKPVMINVKPCQSRENLLPLMALWASSASGLRWKKTT